MVDPVTSVNELTPHRPIRTILKFAVCAHCSWLSKDLEECDRCGSALCSKDTTPCYTSHPQRYASDPQCYASNPQCPQPLSLSEGGAVAASSLSLTVTEPPDLAASLSISPSRGRTPATEGVSGSSMDGSGTAGAPQPVPQALYVNNSALAVASVPSLQPQLQFMTAASLGVPQNQAPISTTVSSGRTSLNSNQTLPQGLRGGTSVQPGPPPALVPVSSAAPNHHPGAYPPPYSEAVSTPGSRRPSHTQAPQPARQQISNSQPSSANGGEGMKVSLEAHQIRVGTRKYMPASNVVFKDDGVLFTLREYTHAPLLLNARAIIRCKANLNPVHPVLFFALEASCVKQIRTIFHMSENEFNEKDELEKKRCITVFPKNLTMEESAAIQHSFNSMKAKFGRIDNILFPIDMDSAIDIIYGNGDRPAATTVNTSSAPSRTNITNGVAANGNRGHPYQRPQQPQQQQPPPAQQHHQQLQRPTAQHQQHRMPNNMMASQLTANNMMLQNMQRHQLQGNLRLPPPPNLGPPRIATTNQPITVPQDAASFAMLQKSLQMNVVYPVIRPNDPTRRVIQCLWTGTTFQPCADQDEIRLHCFNIRVGSMRCQSGEPVIIKNHGSRLSISFKMKVGKDGPCAFEVFEDELPHCFVCYQRISALFLFPTSAFGQRVRYALKMKSTTKDPTYDTNSKEERQRHLILFLRDITPQQKDEMIKLKRMMSQSNKLLFSELDPQGALRILSSIKSNTPQIQQKITDYMGANRAASNGTPSLNSLESLALEIATVDHTPPAADDDDDDVIMTSEELTIKCPYTQQVMKEPVRNKNCNHNYEKMAIIDFIARRRAKGTDKTAKCPYAGCGNQVPLTVEDLENNVELKDYIQKQGNNGATSGGAPATSAS